MQTLYVIICVPKDRVYVGKTNKKEPKYRWTQHLYDLKHDRHPNQKLVEDFLELGEGAFEFKVVRKVKNSEVTEKEAELIAELDAYYNIRLVRKEQ